VHDLEARRDDRGGLLSPEHRLGDLGRVREVRQPRLDDPDPRAGAERVSEELERELGERFARAGIRVVEARLSHLAYSPEIAEAMLRRQQATAVVAARFQIVHGAVSMVEMALKGLSERDIVHLDDERRAAMVSNLLVVLCAENETQPVINTGTLYQ